MTEERITISKANQRKLDRMVQAAITQPRQLVTTHNGRVATDSEGRTYMRERGRGNVRVVIGDDQKPMRVRKWNKARKKAEKRARMRNRK